jgi:hypothetical protein
MTAARTKVVASLAMGLFLLALGPGRASAVPVNVTHTHAAAAGLVWYWPQTSVLRTLVFYGLPWSNAGRDIVEGVKCAGLGSWIVRGGVPMFRDYHCYISPQKGAAYKIVFHVVGQNSYRYSFAGWQAKQRWWWPTQYAADTLVKSGIRWSTGLDRIVYSSCTHFGASRRINGYLYYKLFFCTVTPSIGHSYSVVVDATGSASAQDYFVTYTIELPVTPTNTTPVPASTNTIAQQQNAIVLQNQNNQLFLQTVQSQYKSTSDSTYGSGTGMFGGSSCTWPIC